MRPVVHGTQGNRALALGDDDARERHLAGLGDCFAKDGINVAAGIAIGRQVIGSIVVDRVDGIGVDELLDGHHRRAFDLDAVEILVAQQQILVLPELVAFDEVAALAAPSRFRHPA